MDGTRMMKYVMFEKRGTILTTFHPIIFPNHLVHDEIAAAMIAGPLAGFTVRSAGEWNAVYGCSGWSTTLEKGPHDDDTVIIKTHDYGGGLK